MGILAIEIALENLGRLALYISQLDPTQLESISTLQLIIYHCEDIIIVIIVILSYWIL